MARGDAVRQTANRAATQHQLPRKPGPDRCNARLVSSLKALGYQYVSLDLQGYRLGSLNEALPLRPVS